jgi:AraC-like DNA-binding protein
MDGSTMDILSDALELLRVGRASLERVEAARPWSLAASQGSDGVFHIVLRGQASLALDGAAERELGPWQAVVLPHGDAHTLHDGPGVPVKLEKLARQHAASGNVVLGEGEPSSLFISGRFSFAQSSDGLLLASLPPVMCFAFADVRSTRWLRAVAFMMAQEALEGGPGSRTQVCRLTEALFVQVVRSYVRSPRGIGPGWITALGDRSISSAMGLIHQRPAEPWTVASLASRVGMSRSAFAARFDEVVGEPPLRYVARWRMRVAAEQLRSTRKTLAEVAAAIGYGSEVAFSKAFKRWAGVSPGAYRRSRRRPDP